MFTFKVEPNVGAIVVFLGPDGSGKSTLLQNLRRDFEKDGKKIEIFHLMPRILEKAKNNGPVTNPHSKAPWPVWVSILKLIYYWLDYNLGYWLKVRPLLKRGDIVFFDRYYDDLLVDPRRYRYGGPMWLAKIFSKFIPRPDLFIILDVPEKEVIKRKQEVPIEEIKRQRQEYLKLAYELKDAVIVEASLPPQEVAGQAKSAILNSLQDRDFKKTQKLSNIESAKEYLKHSLNAKISEGKDFIGLFFPDGRGYILSSNPKMATKALSLYGPQKAKSRIFKWILKLGFKAGIAQQFLPKINVDIEWLKEVSREVFNSDDLSFAISLGALGPNKKPVIQVLTPQGNVRGYIKIGWNEATKELVENEGKILSNLSKYNLSFGVPDIVFFKNIKDMLVLMQSPLPEKQEFQMNFSAVHMDAIKSMANISFKYLPLRETFFWNDLKKRINALSDEEVKNFLFTKINDILTFIGDSEMPFHLSHGDFTPWNSVFVKGKLFLYDWEYAHSRPVGYDIFHFLVQSLYRINKYTPDRMIDFFFSQRNDIFRNDYWNMLERDRECVVFPLFGLYLIDRMVIGSIKDEFYLTLIKAFESRFVNRRNVQ